MATTSLLVAVLERAWAAIRDRHPQVPEVVVVVAAGSDGRTRDGLKLGHFAASRWHVGEAQRAEVLVGGEGLARGPVAVLGTLLHEAAHGLAQTREMRDTSRGGRYHNRRFRQLAEELGLTIAETPPIGWSGTTVPETTAAEYAGVLADLERALGLWRVPEQVGEGRSRARNLLACSCACPRRIRVARRTLEEAPILCGACEDAFQPDEVDDEGRLTRTRQPVKRVFDDPAADRERARVRALPQLRAGLPRRHLMGTASAGLPTQPLPLVRRIRPARPRSLLNCIRCRIRGPGGCDRAGQNGCR